VPSARIDPIPCFPYTKQLRGMRLESPSTRMNLPESRTASPRFQGWRLKKNHGKSRIGAQARPSD